MNRIPLGCVAWYAVGRFYQSPEGLLQDLGYFVYLAGLPEPLFSKADAPGEATAYFTFRSTPFRSRALQNGDVGVSLDPAGEFRLFYNPKPEASFEEPDTFSRGQPIATFRRPHVTLGLTVSTVTANVFSADLVSSTAFTFRGQRCDLWDALPGGITQFGTASATPLPGVPGYPKVWAFTGSSIATGALPDALPSR